MVQGDHPAWEDLMVLIRRKRSSGRRAIKSTAAAKSWLLAAHGERRPELVSLVLALARGEFPGGDLVPMQVALDDPTPIHPTILPILPWLTSAIRKAPSQVTTGLYYRQMVRWVEGREDLREPLRKVWGETKDLIVLPWKGSLSARAKAQDLRASPLPLALANSTFHIIGAEADQQIRKKIVQRLLIRLNSNVLKDLAVWQRQTGYDLGPVTLNFALSAMLEHFEDSRWLRATEQSPVVISLPEGWTWQKVLAENLYAVGKTMGNCLGGYSTRVENEASTVYTLNDPSGQPHVAAEVPVRNPVVIAKLWKLWGENFWEDDDWVFLLEDRPGGYKSTAGWRWLVANEGLFEADRWAMEMADEGQSAWEFLPPGPIEGELYPKHPKISEILGKANSKVKAQYVPAVGVLEKWLKGS